VQIEYEFKKDVADLLKMYKITIYLEHYFEQNNVGLFYSEELQIQTNISFNLLTIYAAQKLFLSSVIKVMCVAQNMCSIWI
jgi:hypothetical protein